MQPINLKKIIFLILIAAMIPLVSVADDKMAESESDTEIITEEDLEISESDSNQEYTTDESETDFFSEEEESTIELPVLDTTTFGNLSAVGSAYNVKKAYRQALENDLSVLVKEQKILDYLKEERNFTDSDLKKAKQILIENRENFYNVTQEDFDKIDENPVAALKKLKEMDTGRNKPESLQATRARLANEEIERRKLGLTYDAYRKYKEEEVLKKAAAKDLDNEFNFDMNLFNFKK